MGTKCIVEGCNNTYKTVKVHVFPKDRERFELWARTVKRPDLDIQKRSSYRICDIHFSGVQKYVINRNRSNLKANAVPDINLIDTDPLEIRATQSLFGDSVENIEFVIESDDSEEDETKDNHIVIQVSGLNDSDEELPVSTQPTNNIAINKGNDEVTINLEESDVDEIKDEIEVEDEGLQIPLGEEVEQNEMDEQIPLGRKPNTRCYVPNCTIDANGREPLYWLKVPKEANAIKIWENCIGRPDKKLDVEDTLCHRHFAESDLIYKIHHRRGVVIDVSLRQGAVPCTEFHEKCCVPTCKTTTGPMFTFPVLQTANFDLWLYMIKNPDLKKLNIKDLMKHRVCVVHFEPDCFEKNNTLKSTAAPTLYLPEHNLKQFDTEPVYKHPVKPPLKPNMLSCTYRNCKNTSADNKVMFRFPENPHRCLAWLKACKKWGLISTPEETVKTMAACQLAVCEDHFSVRDFLSSKLLKVEAVPMCEISPVAFIRKSVAFSDESSSSQPGNYKERCKPIFSGVCTYRDCYNKASKDNPFFSFPIDGVRSEKWLKACGLVMSSPASRYQILKNQRICSQHFESHMFESKYKLKPGAIPKPYKKTIQDQDNNEEPNVLVADMDDGEENVEASTALPVKSYYRAYTSNVIHCAVSTCPNNYGKNHGKGRFPDPSKDAERFDIWVKLIANPALKGRSAQEIYNSFMVCLNHFEPEFFMRDGVVNNLSNDAVPTKFLTADYQWLFSSQFYKNRLQNYESIFNKVVDLPDVSQKEYKKIPKESNTTCILEEDGIRFPATGHYLSVERKPNSKRTFPYEIYKFFKSGYGLNDDISVGEKIKIHTAIIIDDDDEVEGQVLQQLLDKRRKH